MRPYGFFGKLTAIPGERDTLLAILLEAAEAMKQESTCAMYRVNVSLDDDSILVYEVWESVDAHQQSLSLETTKTLIERARPVLAKVERLAVFEPRGGY
ncbi:antibiotic biosynthesis monooxygenase [Exiguobacterium sp. SH5S13]|uniref:putative quinol monooxygenase n=1 Tax=Exiguobacterium sp. SH5S13 TaxID=2510959 RepID=UPI00103F1633|nr:antibiotic biosynthesis monooxygenase [Exiguobacterium sp. SH5S13]TCI51406.1 antibiotic biosynthesis monooxygenase [Exiguobacterium sp. SH5S13]